MTELRLLSPTDLRGVGPDAATTPLAPSKRVVLLTRFARRSAVAIIVVAVACSGGGAPSDPLVSTTGTSGNTVAEAGTFVKRTVTVAGVAYPYQVFVPKAYTTAQKWPVIVYVHGGGERGSDGDKQMTAGLGPAVKAQSATFPAFAVFPQIPAGEQFSRTTEYDIVLGALDAVIRTYNVDATRVYLTGISFGGVMSYELAYFNPSRFAALVPVSATISDPLITGNPQAAAGSSYPLVAQTLKTLPTWVWHGTSDGTVSITYPRNIVQAFRNAGANIQYTEIQGGGHSGTTWDVVYGSAQLYQWLWTQHR